MTDQERLFLLSVLGEQPTDEDFKRAAFLLTVKRTEDEVHGMWARAEGGKARMEQAQARRTVQFWEPQPGKEKIQNTNYEWIDSKPPILREILVSQFPEYCRAHGLDEAKLLEVINGQREEYKGYRANNSLFAQNEHRKEVDQLNREMQQEGTVTRKVRLGASPAQDETPKPWKSEEKRKGGTVHLGDISGLF